MTNRIKEIKRKAGWWGVFRAIIVLGLGQIGIGIAAWVLYQDPFTLIGVLLINAIGWSLREQIVRNADLLLKIGNGLLFVYAIGILAVNRLELYPAYRLWVIGWTTAVLFVIQFWTVSDHRIEINEK